MPLHLTETKSLLLQSPKKRDRMTDDSELNGNKQMLNLVHSKFCLCQG